MVSYGFKMRDFHFHFKADDLRTDVIDDCSLLLKKLSDEKLKTVKTLLQNL